MTKTKAALFIFGGAYLIAAGFCGLVGYQSMRALNPLGAALMGITGPAVIVCNTMLSDQPCSGAKLIPHGYESWLFSFEGDFFYREEI